MLCPHCNQEHPITLRFCPTTGSPLTWALPVCPACGRELRPGARYCASCGATLPREIHRQPVEARTHSSGSHPAPQPEVVENSAVPASDAEIPPLPAIPAASAPASDRTQPAPENGGNPAPAWVAVPTSPKARQEWDRQMQRKRATSYLLTGIVLVAVLAGVFYLWSRFQAAAVAANATATAQVILAAGQTETAVQDAAVLTELAVPTSTLPPPPSPTVKITQTSKTPAQTAVDILPTATTGPTATPPGFSSYRLAFYSNRIDQPGIYLMDPDNPDDWIGVPAPESYELFAWPSFCGDQLAFEANDRSLNLPPWIYFYDLTKKELAPIAIQMDTPERAIQPGCSPDGRYLGFTAFHAGRWSMNVLDRQEGTVLAERESGDYSNLGFTTFLPDTDTYLWMGVRASGYYDIIQSTFPTGATRLIAQGKYPSIAPDGSRLVYFCGNLLNLCMVESKTNELLFQIPISYFKKINKKAVPATAAWSSDGKWIYYSSSILGNWDIYRMHPDGSQIQNLTESWTSDEYMPSAR